ncbi:hypothetical protein NDU88_001423 [Pleurodeles waltl]|uniref:Uncharacterized protein n=1 Tax=Pleurodeles waltl TaxID=8319 RepID=A0AAV7SZY8_PLEWA|nr:hypothetical protein NDU88_001423 [Pleurodeles waltl]
MSPARKLKKFRQKSVAGRKITASPHSVVLVKDKEGGGLPGQSFGSRRGGTKFACRSGASIRQPSMFQVLIMILLMRYLVRSGGESVGLHREQTHRRQQFLGHYGRWEFEDVGADSAVYSAVYTKKL